MDSIKPQTAVRGILQEILKFAIVLLGPRSGFTKYYAIYVYGIAKIRNHTILTVHGLVEQI